MISNRLKFFLKVLLFVLVGWLLCNLFPASLGIVDVNASANRTITPNQMSFQTGSSSPVVVGVSSFTYPSYPYMTFYGYTSISDNLWDYAGWTFWSRQTGNYDLSFMYIGAWNTNSNDALSFSITQGSTVYPCTNTPISVKNGSANRAIISVFCPNVSLTANDFTINMEIPSSKLLTGSSIGITPLNLYEQGTTTLQNEVSKATEQIKQTNDILKDDSIDENININQDAITDESGIQDLLLMPLTLMNAVNTGFNSSCSSFSLGSLYGHNLELKCFTISDIIGSNLANIIDVIISGIFIYLFSKHLRKVFDRTTNLENEEGDVI